MLLYVVLIVVIVVFWVVLVVGKVISLISILYWLKFVSVFIWIVVFGEVVW